MKTSKLLALTGLLAAGFVGSASAATEYLYIVGAPAYRSETIKSIKDYIAANYPTTGANAAGVTAAYIASGTDYTTASAVQWLIPNISAGNTLEINASFTGSTAGVEAVSAGNFTQNFIANGTGSVASPNLAVPKASVNVAYQPDVTFSDTFQATTPWSGSFKFATTSPSTFSPVYTFSDLSSFATTVGIEPFVWVGSHGLAAKGVTNITTSQAALLYKYGRLPLAYFTGNSADESSFVYALSRDPGSGSRLVAVSEIGVGAKSVIKTFQPVVSGATADSAGNYVGGTIAAPALTTSPGSVAHPSFPYYPAGQIKSTTVYDSNAGDTGYPSFGTTDQTGLLAAITATPPAGSYFITYLDIADSLEAEGNGAHAEQLTYNGITYSTTAVQEGLYTFWGYENVFPSVALNNAITGTPTDQSNFLVGVQNAFEPAILPTALNVNRTVDGGPVFRNY